MRAYPHPIGPNRIHARARLLSAGVAVQDIDRVLLDVAEIMSPRPTAVMRGWEAFGVAPLGLPRPRWREDEEVTVRRIGTNRVHPNLLDGREAELEDWPSDEVWAGVAGFQIGAYADDRSRSFLQVWGPDRDAVEACWRRVAALIPLDVWA